MNRGALQVCNALCNHKIHKSFLFHGLGSGDHQGLFNPAAATFPQEDFGKHAGLLWPFLVLLNCYITQAVPMIQSHLLLCQSPRPRICTYLFQMQILNGFYLIRTWSYAMDTVTETGINQSVNMSMFQRICPDSQIRPFISIYLYYYFPSTTQYLSASGDEITPGISRNHYFPVSTLIITAVS